MKQVSLAASVFVVALIATWAVPAHAKKCPADSVAVGMLCVDTYEASVWSIPPTATSLIKKVQKGKAVLADLTAGGATQISPSSSCTPAFPGTFAANGQWTAPLYAVSIAGVRPTACVTWFQAEQACRLSNKRLLTNQEWQAAVAGSPDPGPDNGTTDCNTTTAGDAVNTGSRSSCKSSWGAFDMVGNVEEWVADWVPAATACPGWGGFSNDFMCLSGADTTANGPGALLRGGAFSAFGAGAGPLTVRAFDQPSDGSGGDVGFRCAR